MDAQLVNDVHSRLNPTTVDAVARVVSLESIQAALARARKAGKPVSICGGRHAMGGQQFCTGGLLLDTTRLARVLTLDLDRGTIEVEAGIQWPALARALARCPLTFAQKQTGANSLSLGGAVSANVHGRGLTMRPFVDDIDSLVVVGADGRVVRCSRERNADLFALVVGGYGLFGVVYSVTLRLVRRRILERVVQLTTSGELADAFRQRIEEGFVYGDFQFAIDPDVEAFLRDGVFSCYRPVTDRPIPVGQRTLSANDWQHLLALAHTDKSRAFDLYAQHYLATSGQLYLSDRHQLAPYLDGYHDRIGVAGGEMITELYVPRDRLAAFMAGAADALRRGRANVVYGTVRLIERDTDTFLAWARRTWACIVLNLHVHAGDDGARHFRALIDLALAESGSYYLTYHRHATRAQADAAHPRLREFLACKRDVDPGGVFQSDWYRRQVALFADRRTA